MANEKKIIQIKSFNVRNKSFLIFAVLNPTFAQNGDETFK